MRAAAWGREEDRGAGQCWGHRQVAFLMCSWVAPMLLVIKNHMWSRRFWNAPLLGRVR